MEGDLSVASAGTSDRTRSTMESLEKAQVPHNRLEKGSRIPIKSKMPQHSQQKKLTSQTQAQTSQNAITSPGRSQGRGKSAACQDKEKPSNHLTSRVRPTASMREGDEGKGKPAGSEGAKENVAPSNGGQHGHTVAKKTSVKRCVCVCVCVTVYMCGVECTYVRTRGSRWYPKPHLSISGSG